MRKNFKFDKNEIREEVISERGTNRKVFKMKNGAHVMALSREPMHYLDKESGKYEEIKNEITPGEQGLGCKCGEYEITLPDGKNNAETVKLTKDTSSIEWMYIGKDIHSKEKRGRGKKLPVPFVDSIPGHKLHMANGSKGKSRVQYGNVDDSIDIEYEVRNNALKENIVIRDRSDRYNFEFAVKVTDLVPEIDSDKKTIKFTDPEKKVTKFSIPAPMMYDAKKNYSSAVEYDLKAAGKDEYILTVKADSEWINSSDRAMPVYLDPAVQFDQNVDVPVGYVNSREGLDGISAGYDGLINWTSTIYALININSENMVYTGAYLYLEERSSFGDNDFRWSLSGLDTENEASTKYYGCIGDDRPYYMIPVSDNVAAAIEDGKDVTTFRLEPTITADSVGQVVFDPSTAVLYICYRDTLDYTDNPTGMYIRADYGSATENVNLFTGELIHTHVDVETGSAAFPISIAHKFTGHDLTTDIGYGLGWTLAYDQYIRYEYVDEEKILPMVYWDGNGKRHYFASNELIGPGGQTYYTDIDGLELKFSTEARGMTIRDKTGGCLLFDVDGNLSELSDANGNCATITRNTSGRITSVEDNFGRRITLTYSADNKLQSMTDPSSRTVTYAYTAGRLSTVTYPDGTTLRYEYDAGGRMSCVTAIDGVKTVYEYASTSSSPFARVVSVKKFAADADTTTDSPEELRNIHYVSSSTTAVTTRSGVTRVYAFDESGRTIMEYEVDNYGENVWIPNLAAKNATGTILHQYSNGKRTFSSSIRTSYQSDNMIKNGDFANENDPSWVFVGTADEDDGIKNGQYNIVGNYSNEKYIKQTIAADKINLEHGDTLVYSAWACAESFETGSEDGGPKFELRAEVHYKDNTTTKESAKFDTGYTSWQYAALPIRIDRTKELDCVTVYLDFSRNNPYTTCIFDNVWLVNAPTQYVTYEDTPGVDVVRAFGSFSPVWKKVTTHDGIYTVLEEKDINENVVRRTVTDLDGNSFVSVFKYDDRHHVIASQNDRNIVTEATYNSVGMQTSVKAYYWSEFAPTTIPTPTEFFYQETTYDETGEFATAVADNRSDDIKTTNTFDKTRGLTLSTTSPNGQSTDYTYNNANDLVTSVCATVGDAQYSVLYDYDAARRLTAITHNGFEYGFTYDGMGRTKTVSIAGQTYTTNDYVLTDTTTVTTTYAGGEKMTVETDRHDQPVRRTYTDKNGNVTEMATGEYDSLGKPVKVIDKVTGKCYTYTYDTYENVTEEKVNGVAFKTYEHDEHNRLTSTTVKVGDGTHVYRPIYDTCADGKIYSDNAVVGVTLDGKFTARAEHDNLGRVTRKSLKLNGATSALIAEELTYLTTAEGTNTRLTNMVETFTNKVNGTAVDSLSYVYDNNGNITEIKRDGEVLIQYAYDGLNQLIREDNAILGTICTYTYDTAGNITEKKVFSRTALGVGVLEQTIPYTYATTGWKDRLISYNGQSITYDALGNPTTYRGHSLTWGKIKQLEAYDTNTFAYNAEGIRVRKNNITYELDGTQILREVRGVNVIEYFYGSNGVAGLSYNGTQYYYQKNLLGDIVAIYTTFGTKVAEYVYDAWGKCSVTLDTNGIATLNPFRYRGYYYDIETGLYYLQSRYYDPEVGRFVNADDVMMVGSNDDFASYNLFAYCGNNPVDRKDDSGFFWKKLKKVGEALVYGALQAALILLGLLSIISAVLLVIAAFVGTFGSGGAGAIAIPVAISMALELIVAGAIIVVEGTAVLVAAGALAFAAGEIGESSERKFNVSKQESDIFNSFDRVKGKSYRTSGKGKNTRFYDWDNTHNDIEVYDRHGNHLGSMDPTTGEIYKPAVKGRKLKW